MRRFWVEVAFVVIVVLAVLGANLAFKYGGWAGAGGAMLVGLSLAAARFSGRVEERGRH